MLIPNLIPLILPQERESMIKIMLALLLLLRANIYLPWQGKELLMVNK